MKCVFAQTGLITKGHVLTFSLLQRSLTKWSAGRLERKGNQPIFSKYVNATDALVPLHIHKHICIGQFAFLFVQYIDTVHWLMLVKTKVSNLTATSTTTNSKWQVASVAVAASSAVQCLFLQRPLFLFIRLLIINLAGSQGRWKVKMCICQWHVTGITRYVNGGDHQNTWWAINVSADCTTQFANEDLWLCW